MISHNMTWLKYPSQNPDSSANFEEIIFAQNIISRFMHVYIAIFVPTGLLAGIFVLAILIKNKVQHALEKLDTLILAHAINNVLMILSSLTVSARPDYLKVSYLACGALSFFFNFSYFSSQNLLVLMMLSFFLHQYPPQNALIGKANRNPMVCVTLALVCAFCSALTVVVLLGTQNYHEGTDCQLDPLFSWPEYEIIKFSFGFALPSLVQLLGFILLFVKATRSEIHSPGQKIHPYVTVWVITITAFVGRLFYNTMILSRTILKVERRTGTPQNELTMNIAEILLFCESCMSLVITLCLHTPCRSGFRNIIIPLTKICRKSHTSHSLPLEMTETHTEVTSETEAH